MPVIADLNRVEADCLLKHPASGCPLKEGQCTVLGKCGARHMLREAGEPGGYEVVVDDNKILNALAEAGLVDVAQGEKWRNKNHVMVYTGVVTARTTI